MKNLKLNDIYNTISGEAGIFPQGAYCTIIRLQGCNLRCIYCDTPQGWENEEYKPEMNAVLEDMLKNGKIANRVMITGGEPLVQQGSLLNLIKELRVKDHEVQIETNGSLPLPCIVDNVWWEGVGWVVDYKMPCSGMYEKMGGVANFSRRLRGVYHEPGEVVIKFVFDESDIPIMVDTINELATHYSKRDANPRYRGDFILSPIDADKTLLSKAIEAVRKGDEKHKTKLLERCVFSLQLHKIVNMP